MISFIPKRFLSFAKELFLPALLLIALPLFGAMLAGKPIAQYLEFPPTTRYVRHAGFSWPVFTAIAFVSLSLAAPIFFHLYRNWRENTRPLADRGSWPWWGWLGIVLGMISWIMAWTRFTWFAPFQPFTFSPLWFSYILTVNAMTYKKSGRCMLKDRPLFFLRLFPASAFFWWFFEYLNRFVQNWYYVGVEGIPPWKYFILATLPFSTVLPAVLGTHEFLETVFGAEKTGQIAPRSSFHRLVTARLLFALSCLGLAGIAIRPDYLFALLWLSPLVILDSLRTIRGKESFLLDLTRVDRRRICLLATSALICGFFWEMWNYYSLAKWIYAVPYVTQFKLFEMPILGYAGYLPFGLECALIARMIEIPSAPPRV